MPDSRKNLGYAARALARGGSDLAELTGEDEPERAPRNMLSEGFSRLRGAEPAARKRYQED